MKDLTLLQTTPTQLIVAIIFVLVITFYIVGHRLRVRAIAKNPEKATHELTAINGMLLGLLGLLLAFTFSMSSSRFDTRRQLVIEEANDIGTVILRTDVFPDSARQLLRSNLKAYVDQRIAFYEVGMDPKRAAEHFGRADSLGKVVWSIAAAQAKSDPTLTKVAELIPALNAMIDVTTTRLAAGEATVPDAIMYFLFSLCFCSSFLLGYDNKHPKIDWIIVGGFALMLSMTVYMIVDLDRPRSGVINLDRPNQKMIELREMF